jgi:heat shock protein HslJ
VLGALSGRTFISTAVHGRDLVAKTVVTLSFGSDSQMSANAGCNTMSGKAVVTDGVLTVPIMATTAMGCGAELMAQDMWLSDLLTKGAKVATSGTRLILSGDGVTISLQDEKIVNPDRPLVGTTWLLDGIVANNAVTHYGVIATMTIQDGRIGYRACNTHSGTITITGNTATTGMMMSTNMACPDDRSEVDRAMESVLNGTWTFEIDGSRLAVNGQDGKGLQFVAQPGSGTTGTPPVTGSTGGVTASGSAPVTTGSSLPLATPMVPSGPRTMIPTSPGSSGKSLTMPPRMTGGRHDSIPPQPTRNTANETW